MLYHVIRILKCIKMYFSCLRKHKISWYKNNELFIRVPKQLPNKTLIEKDILIIISVE